MEIFTVAIGRERQEISQTLARIFRYLFCVNFEYKYEIIYRMKNGFSKPKLTEQGTIQTFAQYDAKVARFLTNHLDKAWGLIYGTANSISQCESLVTHDDVPVYAASSALLALLMNTNSTIGQGFADTMEITIYPDEAKILAKDALGIQTDTYPKNEIEENYSWKLVANLVAIYSLMQKHQGDTINRLANFFVLSGMTGLMGLPKNTEELERLYQNDIGITTFDYLNCIIGIQALVNQSKPTIDLRNMLSKSKNKEKLLPIMVAVLDALSLDATNLKMRSQILTKPFDSYSGHFLSETFFDRFPLIKMSPEIYLASGHQYLRAQLINKFLLKGLSLAREDDPESKGNTELAKTVAVRMEQYFGILVQQFWKPTGKVIPEFEYEYKKSIHKTPDFIVFEKISKGKKTQKYCTLFQLKTKALSEATTANSDLKTLEDDLRQISGSISQSISFLFYLFNGGVEKDKSEFDLDDLRKEIIASKALSLVGVYPDLPPIFSVFQIRVKTIELVKAYLKDKKKIEHWEWFVKTFDGKWQWHIFDLQEFQTFLRLPGKHRRFGYELKRFLRDTDCDSGFHVHNGFPMGFRNYIIQNFNPAQTGNPHHKLEPFIDDLKTIHDDTYKAATAYLLGAK